MDNGVNRRMKVSECVQGARTLEGIRKTHLACLHRPNRLILRIMRDIGRRVEEIVNPVACIRPHDGAPVRARDGLTAPTQPPSRINESRDAHAGPLDVVAWTYIVFPRSRKRKPGLQSLIASSKHSLAVRINFCESSSIRPTGYVSFTSPWKPAVQTTTSHNIVLAMSSLRPNRMRKAKMCLPS